VPNFLRYDVYPVESFTQFSAFYDFGAATAAYVEALGRAGDSLVRSVAYAFIGATLLTVLGFFTGYLIQTKALRCWWSIDSITIFLFALPGTVIGIGVIGLWNT